MRHTPIRALFAEKYHKHIGYICITHGDLYTPAMSPSMPMNQHGNKSKAHQARIKAGAEALKIATDEAKEVT